MKQVAQVGLGLLLLVAVAASPAAAQLSAGVAPDGSLVVNGPDGNPLMFRATLTLGASSDLLYSTVNQVQEDTLAGIASPALGDSAAFWTSTYDDPNGNSYGFDLRTTAEMWSDQDYMVTTFTLVNHRDLAFAGFVSLEIVPTLEGDNQYGGETADLNSDQAIASLWEGDRHLGFQLANRELVSYRTPDYTEFEDAADPQVFRYDQMRSGANSDLPVQSDYGLLVFVNLGNRSLPVGDSLEVAVVWGYGADQAAMETAVLEGRAAYDAVGVADPRNTTLPSSIALSPAWPNPFNASTMIEVTLPRAAQGRVEVVDLLGRRVATLASGTLAAGATRLNWQAEGTASGEYFIVLSAGAERQVRRVTLLR